LYKQDLHQWIEERLHSNLQDRLHTALYSSLDAVHNEIKDHVKSIISNPKRQSDVDAIVLRSDFTVSYRLDCSNLCSDFHEDIQFKFSLGLTSLWKRFIENQNDTQYSTALTSKSGLIALGACALVWQSVGWKVLGFIAGIYGGFYAYERLMWTRKAQERAFKRQYADYTSSKMRLIVDLTSGNASAQVQQELSRYFAQTIQYINLEKDDLYDQIQELKNRINQLKFNLTNGQKIKKQSDKIDNELNQFIKQYLLIDSTN
jgi:mitofusin